MPMMNLFTDHRLQNRSLMTNWMTLVRSLVLIFTVIIVDPASAMDFATLGQLLTPAYTAMSFARLCTMEPEWLASEPRGKRGSAIDYAEHVKDETIESLTYEDAVIVLRSAAEAAKAEAQKQLKEKVISQDKAAEAVRFKTWCNGYVTPFILAFINQHDSDHASFLEQLGLAKRDKAP